MKQTTAEGKTEN